MLDAGAGVMSAPEKARSLDVAGGSDPVTEGKLVDEAVGNDDVWRSVDVALRLEGLLPKDGTNSFAVARISPRGFSSTS